MINTVCNSCHLCNLNFSLPFIFCKDKDFFQVKILYKICIDSLRMFASLTHFWEVYIEKDLVHLWSNFAPSEKYLRQIVNFRHVIFFSFYRYAYDLTPFCEIVYFLFFFVLSKSS